MKGQDDKGGRNTVESEYIKGINKKINTASHI